MTFSVLNGFQNFYHQSILPKKKTWINLFGNFTFPHNMELKSPTHLSVKINSKVMIYSFELTINHEPSIEARKTSREMIIFFFFLETVKRGNESWRWGP